MSACEQWAREHDIAKLQLMVRGENADAVAVYAALGYAHDEVVVLGRRLEPSTRRDRL